MILTSFGQCLAKAGAVMAMSTAAATRIVFMDIPPCEVSAVKCPPITSMEAILRTIRKGVNENSTFPG
jgi:hypothetical protein